MQSLYDDEYDALNRMVANSSKSAKDLAVYLFPHLKMDSAYARLKACLNPEKDDKLSFGLIRYPDVITRVHGLGPEAFYQPQHAEIYRALQRLFASGQPIEAIAVSVDMQSHGVEIGLEDIESLSASAPGPASVRMLAGAVMDCHRLRQLMDAGREIGELAMTAGYNSTEQIDKANMLLAKLGTVKARREPQDINEALTNYLALLQDLSDGKNATMSTGIGGLDEILNGGLRAGEVLVLGARPKHGKTALALAIARHMARRNKVLYLSQEMPVSQLMHRHTAAAGSMDLSRILKADPADKDMWTAVTEAAHTLGALTLYHDDQCALSLFDIRRKVQQVSRRAKGLHVMVVDFLQLMAGAGDAALRAELAAAAAGGQVPGRGGKCSGDLPLAGAGRGRHRDGADRGEREGQD